MIESRGSEHPAIRSLLRMRPAAWSLAARMLGSEQCAEDIVQQAYVNAIAHLRVGPVPRNEDAWFLTVVANAVRDHWRREAAVRRMAMFVPRERPPVEGLGADGDLVKGLRTALRLLDKKYREPVALCCQQGLTHREAAAALEMPRSTVTKRVEEGLAQLRRSLSG
jgi:RNA polymerase sigma-70 factor (ECF subfamily)